MKQFTTDWFSNNIPIWDKLLEKFKNKSNLNFLEIGCWEGRATCYLLENILTDKSSKITVIDTFEGSLNESGMMNKEVNNLYDRFKSNINEYSDKVTILKGYSDKILRTLNDSFDFVYIDARHTAYGVLEDAILVHPLLKLNGIIIFDDYLWNDIENPHITNRPQIGIESFCNCYSDFYNLIFKGYQIGLVKKSSN